MSDGNVDASSSYEGKVVFLLKYPDKDELVPKALNFSFTVETTREEVFEFVSYIAPRISKTSSLEADVSDLDLFCVHEGTAYYIRPGQHLLQSKYVRAAVASPKKLCSLMLTRSRESSFSDAALQRQQTMSLMRQPIASPGTVVNTVRDSTTVPATDLPPVTKRDVKAAEKYVRDGIYLLHDARVASDAPHWTAKVPELYTTDSWVGAAEEECSANERWIKSLEAEIERAQRDTAHACTHKDRVNAEIEGLRRSLAENEPYTTKRDRLEAELKVLKAQVELMHCNDGIFAPDDSKKRQQQNKKKRGTAPGANSRHREQQKAEVELQPTKQHAADRGEPAAAGSTTVVYSSAKSKEEEEEEQKERSARNERAAKPPPHPTTINVGTVTSTVTTAERSTDPRWEINSPKAEEQDRSGSDSTAVQPPSSSGFNSRSRDLPTLTMPEDLARDVSDILGTTAASISYKRSDSDAGGSSGGAADPYYSRAPYHTGSSHHTHPHQVGLSVRVLASDLNQYLASGVRDRKMRVQLLQRIDQIRQKMEWEEQNK